MSKAIRDGMVVSFHYTLTDDAGQVLDSSRDGDPVDYLHGASNIVPGLERELENHVAGDKLQVKVAPEDGYGRREGPGPQAFPRDAFPTGMLLSEGMQFEAESDDGDIIPLWITKVEKDTVYVDANHPLADKTLHFDVEITAVRTATPEEVEHGHPHGPDGHDDDE